MSNQRRMKRELAGLHPRLQAEAIKGKRIVSRVVKVKR